jgi:hypothetical protein
MFQMCRQCSTFHGLRPIWPGGPGSTSPRGSGPIKRRCDPPGDNGLTGSPGVVFLTVRRQWRMADDKRELIMMRGGAGTDVRCGSGFLCIVEEGLVTSTSLNGSNGPRKLWLVFAALRCGWDRSLIMLRRPQTGELITNDPGYPIRNRAPLQTNTVWRMSPPRRWKAGSSSAADLLKRRSGFR